MMYTASNAQQDFVIIDGQVIVPEKVPPPVPSRPCLRIPRARCEELRGGYQFNWYSPKWDAAYRSGARPGSWRPGECEDDV